MTARRDNDPDVVAGNAVGVALMIGAKSIRWTAWEAQVAVHAIADRLGVSVDFVRDTVQLLVLLHYLEDTGEATRGRQVYRPALPAQYASKAQPINETDRNVARSAA